MKTVWIVFEDDQFGCGCSNNRTIRGIFTSEKSAQELKKQIDKRLRRTYYTDVESFEVQE